MYKKVFLTYLFVILAISSLVQLYVLPTYFPKYCNEDGLIYGIDVIDFHDIAVKQAKKINEQGWDSWELRPEGQGPAGIASLFYCWITPKPWTLLPLNSLLHALSAFLLTMMAYRFIGIMKFAIVSALPFTLFPSSYLWVSQIHKDSFFIAGIMMVLFGFSSVFYLIETNRNKVWAYILCAGSVIFGSILVWIVRPYAIAILLAYSLIFFSLVCLCVLRATPSCRSLHKYFILVFLLALSSVFFVQFVKKDITKFHSSATERLESNWIPSKWLGLSLDRRIHRLYQTRQLFLISSNTKRDISSTIDADVELNSAFKLLMYIPRALQIALLSPFPNLWVTPSNNRDGEIKRKFAIYETCIVYFCLTGIIYCIFKNRFSYQFWSIFLFCTFFLIVYAVAMPNIGTLYRTRYAFLQTHVAFGIIGHFLLYGRLKKTHRIDGLNQNELSNPHVQL